MARVLLRLLAPLLLVGAALTWASGARSAGPVAIGALITAIALVGERWQYRRQARPSLARDWQDNGERFVDPGSGRRLKVQFNAATGERRYVPDEPGSARATEPGQDGIG